MDLKEYLKMHDIDAKAFARLAKISHSTALLLKGKEVIPRLDTALRVRAASNGVVSLESMATQVKRRPNKKDAKLEAGLKAAREIEAAIQQLESSKYQENVENGCENKPL